MNKTESEMLNTLKKMGEHIEVLNHNSTDMAKDFKRVADSIERMENNNQKNLWKALFAVLTILATMWGVAKFG